MTSYETDRFGRRVAILDPACKNLITGRHYYENDFQWIGTGMNPNAVCEYCHKKLYVSGALWVTRKAVTPGPTIILQEEPDLDDLR